MAEYTPELAVKICELIADGLSLRKICAREGMPNRASVFRWLRDTPEFVTMYNIARDEQADVCFDEVLEIADDGSNDWMANNDPENPGYRFNGEHFGRSRLRIDTRKWKLARMNAKKYGDKVETTMLGANGGPVQHTIEWVSGVAPATK